MSQYGEMVIGDDGFVDIVGEQTRGGHTVGRDAAYDILGELMDRSPAVKTFVQERIVNSRPMVKRQPYQKAQDWQIDFGPTCSGAGTTTTITVNPQCLFRGEKVMATDTYSTAGIGTRVSTILVGNYLQRPASTSTLTLFFAQNALGNGIKWATCQKGLAISVTVSFVQTCTFDMTVFGKAVL